MDELKIKEDFIPDVVCIDYLNICSSANLPQSAKSSPYIYVKNISEEIRAFATEYNVAVLTATQTNRDGFNSNDPDLTNTSESWGLPATSDLFLAMVTNEAMESVNQYMMIQLKSRYNHKAKKRFQLGYDLTKMKLYDVTSSSDTLENINQMNSTVSQKPIAKNTGLNFGGIKV